MYYLHDRHIISKTILLSIANVGSLIVQNYDKVSGAVLTTLSIMYLIWKWKNEYKVKNRLKKLNNGIRTKYK